MSKFALMVASAIVASVSGEEMEFSIQIQNEETDRGFNCRTKEVWTKKKKIFCCKTKNIGCLNLAGNVKPEVEYDPSNNKNNKNDKNNGFEITFPENTENGFPFPDITFPENIGDGFKGPFCSDGPIPLYTSPIPGKFPLAGEDALAIKGRSTPEECMEKCNANSDCVAVQFHKKKHMCYLAKGGRPDMVTMAKWKGQVMFQSFIKLPACGDVSILPFNPEEEILLVEGDHEHDVPCEIEDGSGASPLDLFGEEKKFRVVKGVIKKLFVDDKQQCALTCLEFGDKCIGMQNKFVKRKNRFACQLVGEFNPKFINRKAHGWVAQEKACKSESAPAKKTTTTTTTTTVPKPCPDNAIDGFTSSNGRLQKSKSHTIRTFKNTDTDACAEKCIQTEGCVAFEFLAKRNKKICELKSTSKSKGTKVQKSRSWMHFDLGCALK